MARRKTLIATGEIYHVYNRSVASQPIFDNKYNLNRFLNIIDFYRFSNTGLRFSHFDRMDKKIQNKFLESLYDSPLQIEIYALCIMSNHYHFLIKQLSDNGIGKFASNIQNSFAKYYNLKTKRFGAIFQSPFKAVRIESEEQLTHTARYIHLNPITSFILREFDELTDYPSCSLVDYISKSPRPFIETSLLLNLFGSKKKLEEFTSDQVEYQQNLEVIKHLAID